MAVTQFAILDAARDNLRVGAAAKVSPEHDSLFAGPGGERLKHVAPHFFACDSAGVVVHMAMSGIPPDEVGVVIETSSEFTTVRKHLRRFLVVLRERDRRRVYFRFYDPRVLRAFLPVCTRDELIQFFGPISAFHCQGDVSGQVISFSLNDGVLVTQRNSFSDFMHQRYGVRPEDVPAVLEQLLGVGHFAPGRGS